jgi:hypothetical protein
VHSSCSGVTESSEAICAIGILIVSSDGIDIYPYKFSIDDRSLYLMIPGYGADYKVNELNDTKSTKVSLVLERLGGSLEVLLSEV